MSRTRTPVPDAAIKAAFRLGHIVQKREQLEDQILAGVREIIAKGGDWTTVGIALGVSRQAAHQRFASRI